MPFGASFLALPMILNCYNVEVVKGNVKAVMGNVEAVKGNVEAVMGSLMKIACTEFSAGAVQRLNIITFPKLQMNTL